MPHSRAVRKPKRRRSPRTQKNLQRSLRGESLERRLLLTTITGVDPAASTVVAPTTADIAVTFDQPINAATATLDNLVVSRGSVGQLGAATATISTSGQTVTVDPSTNFSPGEIVRVTATSGIQSTTGEANTPRSWEFRAAVSAGSGDFSDSGQRLGVNQDGTIEFGDLDGDGDLDVAQGGNLIWINDGTGNFTSNGQTLNGGIDWDLADIDGDGDLDVVAENNIFLNDGSAMFSPTGQDLTPGVNGLALELGDIDGDGDMDAMVGVAYGANLVWTNDGNGTFTNTGQGLGTAASEGIGFGDFDGDGDLDAYVANSGFDNRVYFNDGAGNFTNSGQALGGFQESVAVDVGDLDGDGDLDALVANGPGGRGTRVWLNDGSGTFTETGQQLNAGTTNNDASLGDIDGDGDLDAYVTGWYNPSQIWTNDGNGMFTQSQTVAFPGQRPGWVNFGDVDGDGDLDVFEGNRFADGNRVLINQNLEPSVTLAADPAAVAEDAGVSTLTVTLSEAHTVPVTVDLATSGTATPTDDYTISATQIVIPVGSTSGTIAITAVQDSVDEPDETVIVDITSIANGQEAGTQQATVTIQDDDEPVPDVTLAVDNATIGEAGEVATFTASLSAATDVPVTIDLTIGGTATAGDDYTASATQIVIATGATSGSVTVTAVQDAGDEPDETVIVEISGVVNGNEAGDQQATTTILDDDEPVMPDVTLAADTTSIPEEVGVATLTVTLSEATTAPVTVDLAITGTATSGDDYTASATQVTFAPGSTSANVTITAVQDTVDEPDETVIVDIASVAGGNEVGEQQATITIVDDEVPPSFRVASLTTTDSGFVAELNNALDGADINLYDTQNAALGAADVTLSGATSGNVAGSLIVGDDSVTFIASGGPLAADTYTVTLRSDANAFEDTTGQLLDGNADGTGGDDYVMTFTVDAAPEGARVVSIPDFVRGPGQDVNIPADGTTGIPISISEGANVRAADIRISYDPALLEITGATAPEGGTVVLNTTTTPGVAILVYFATTALPAGETTFINLQATVPAENASTIYQSQQVLDVHDVIIGDGNDNEFPVVVDDALHFATYFADVSGNGRINASDAAQVARFAALIDSGFAASLNTDPIVVGDISGNGRINAADASRVAQFAALIPVPEIPPVPGGIVITGVNQVPGGLLDESLSNPTSATNPADAGETADLQFRVVTEFISAGSDNGDVVDAALEGDSSDEDALLPSLEDAIAALVG